MKMQWVRSCRWFGDELDGTVQPRGSTLLCLVRLGPSGLLTILNRVYCMMCF